VENPSTPNFSIRKVTVQDIKEVYRLLVANRPYVGLNSRYTYFLLARDFQDTCLIAQVADKIVAFASGYLSPKRPDTFFSWEVVVDKPYRGNGLQKMLLLNQLRLSGARYFEATVNPSNPASKNSYLTLARLLDAGVEERLLFSEADFEFDGHEAEVLLRIGPISKSALERLLLAQ
jgi:L-2,4-diaminobutyric acid acetyltransferase